MMENKSEAKNLKEHISCGCKCNFNNTKCKIIISAKIIAGILAHVFVRIASI